MRGIVKTFRRTPACRAGDRNGGFPSVEAKGGVATAWMLYEMASRNMPPLALLLNHANPVMAQGAALARISLMDRFETDITEVVHTDDEIEIDTQKGLVRILARAPSGGS